jgi:hypothetical protein
MLLREFGYLGCILTVAGEPRTHKRRAIRDKTTDPHNGRDAEK